MGGMGDGGRCSPEGRGLIRLYSTLRGDVLLLLLHVLHFSFTTLSCKGGSARAEAWEGKSPGSVRRLLADPRWERRFVHFLELSGVGRTLADGVDEESAYASRMDTWIAWETDEATEVERLAPRGDG
jgi:hypothetical protein